MSKPDDAFEPESSIVPDNRDTFRPPEDEVTPRGRQVAAFAAVVIVLATALLTTGFFIGRSVPEGTWQDRALAAVREAVEGGCGDVQVYGGTITGPQAAKRMDAAISAVRQLAMLQGYAVFQADSWSQGPESAGGAVVVAKCGG